MNKWWQQRSENEQRLLQLAALILSLTLIWLWGWEPLTAKNQSLDSRIAQQQVALLELNRLVQQAQTHSSQGTVSTPVDGNSLLVLADKTARASRLAGSLRRIQPDGDQRVDIWLEQAAFDQIMIWLEGVSRDNQTLITAVNINQGEQAGLVNAQITLESPQ